MKTVSRLVCCILLLAVLLMQVQAATELEEIIIDSCRYGHTAELSEYMVSREALDRTFTRLLETGKLPWYITGQYEYSYDESTGMVQSFTPQVLPQSYDRELYERTLAELMDRWIHPGMTPEQIALAVHDQLVLMGHYDETLKKNTSYDLLIDGTAVCAGYTYLYQDILNRAGVPCVSVTSEAMEHTWNLVQLEGSWYHVDLTWDDPTPDVYGVVQHTYFLLTDAQISDGEKPHYGWASTITCSDDRYENAYWRDIDSAIIFPGDGNAYYFREQDYSGRVIKRDPVSHAESILFYEKSPTYLNFGHGTYTYYHTGLSYWDGKFYFGTLDRVYAMDPAGNREEVYTFDTTSKKQYIFSCYVADDTLYMATADHAGNFYSQVAALEVSAEQLSQRHVHSYTKTETAATCTEPGYVTATCQCGVSYESGWYIQPHSYAPTTSVGNKTREACTVCGQTRVTGTVTQTDTPALEKDRNYRYLYVSGGVAVTGLLVSLLSKKRK